LRPSIGYWWIPRSGEIWTNAANAASAVSISSNIAEGTARNSTKEFIQFLYISLGSLSELETQVLNIRGTGYGRFIVPIPEVRIIS
jgi:hypothetical protein